MTTAELIEKLERAEGPSRELDFAILCEIDRRAKKTGPVYSDPRYTASIDAAMTLVPFHKDRDGNQTTQMKWSFNPGFRSSFKMGGVKFENLQKTDREYEGEWFFVARVYGSEGRHKDPALALCIAALKAKEADND